MKGFRIQAHFNFVEILYKKTMLNIKIWPIKEEQWLAGSLKSTPSITTSPLYSWVCVTVVLFCASVSLQSVWIVPDLSVSVPLQAFIVSELFNLGLTLLQSAMRALTLSYLK